MLRCRMLLVLGAAGACDDAAVQMVPVDSPPPCWNPVDTVARGEAVLGTGYSQFQPMPEELPLEFGTQFGFNLVANVQMRGLVPGDPKDVFAPGNPKTRILAYFDDGITPLNRHSGCPYSLGYKQIDGETYEMAEGAGIIFETCWRSEHLFGRRIRIRLEILDSANGYTTDERVVIAAPPLVHNYPTNENQRGCDPVLREDHPAEL